MQGEATNHHIELGMFEGKILGVAGAEGYVFEPALLHAFVGDGKHRFGEVEADYFTGLAGESFSDMAGASGHIENALVTLELCSANEPANAFFVGDPGIGGESRGLGCERLTNDVVVLSHRKRLTQR